MPAAPFDQRGQLRWLMPLRPDQRFDDAVWYRDGSMLNGRWKALRATGFGIAVVSKQGDLLAYGLGCPPSWCSTAAAAEVWAVQVILTLCPFAPQMHTDCMAIITIAVAPLRTTPDRWPEFKLALLESFGMMLPFWRLKKSWCGSPCPQVGHGRWRNQTQQWNQVVLC